MSKLTINNFTNIEGYTYHAISGWSKWSNDNIPIDAAWLQIRNANELDNAYICYASMVNGGDYEVTIRRRAFIDTINPEARYTIEVGNIHAELLSKKELRLDNVLHIIKEVVLTHRLGLDSAPLPPF